MEMLQCRLILASLLVLSGCFFEVSCQTVTYTTKDAESLPCAKTGQTIGVTWSETTVGNENVVLLYQKGNPPVVNISTEAKYTNFNYTLTPTSLNLVIENVEDGDGGVYNCAAFGATPVEFDVTVEVLVKPTVQYESQDVVELDVIVGTQYNLTCSATRARSVSDLSLMWDPSLVETTPLVITSNDDYKDYSITSTYTAVRGVSSITCQLTGYVMQDEINNQRMDKISHTVILNVQYAPVCNMTIPDGEDCREVTLTCECEAVPADITQYSFFNGSSNINDGTSKMFTVSVVYGTSTGFSCSATNEVGPGEKSDVKVHDCEKGTTALPTTTIVTTAPLSTNEPTSTKDATTSTMHTEDSTTESTTEKSGSTTTEKSGGLTTGAKIGISLGAVAVVVVIVVVAVILWKNGKCGSNSSSDKLDDNGAGPRGDPEIPAYGVVDKNRTKDPTPAPRSSMRDSTNPSKPKQDGQMEMQYADLDHGNKPASDEVRKPKEEPTEYATVQSVIV